MVEWSGDHLDYIPFGKSHTYIQQEKNG
jgi:hypothetical protein